ncbi:hypothetical protein J2752_001975 [Halarchaeum rubridurum]|nr:hypothetical protein [Halarchaeum rubridurum]
MLTLQYLLEENGVTVSDWPGQGIEETIRESKEFLRSAGARRLDQLWEKDPLYTIWLDHFVQLFRSRS